MVVVIDFRYHLVSIIAIFLALALGIVFGTTALNGNIVDNLRSSNNGLIKEKRGLETSVRDLRNQVGRRDEFTKAMAASLVAGRLPDERVLFVATPDASADTLKELQDIVARSGALSTGVLRLRGDLLDPTKSQVVDDVVARVAPAGLSLPEGTPTDRAAVQLAAALTARGGTDGLSDDASAKVIGGYSAADLVQFQPPAEPNDDPATLVVLVTAGGPGEPLDEAAQLEQRGVLTLARALDTRSDGVVVAGPVASAEAGGLIEAVRADSDLRERVSTVDVADAPYGQVAVILALDEQDAGGAGRYGQGPGSEAAAPTPAT